MNETIDLAEPIFYSICGEGSEIGRPAYFVRAFGCNRKCLYCDTKYSYEGRGTPTPIRDIVSHVSKDSSPVFLTGGEITIQPTLLELVTSLDKANREIMLQTNGTVFRPLVFEKVDLLSVDVKGPSSGRLADPKVIHQIYHWFLNKGSDTALQFKFVIGSREDFIYARDVSMNYPTITKVFQPEYGQGNLAKLSEWVLEDRDLRHILNIRVLPQLHKIIGVK